MKGNPFIRRPMAAFAISILIVIVGVISLLSLPIEQYPDIAPPTVMVSTSYPGADADAVMNSVIVPLEESINGVENMMYMSSTATNSGSGSITIYFNQGTDPDMAAINVQNRVSMAQGLLPAEVVQIGVTTFKRQTSMLQSVALWCPDGRYDESFIANYLDINVIPEIKRVNGVGDVMEMGDTYSMRIWLNPERMAQYGLVPSDISAVLNEQNLEAPTGSLGENSGDSMTADVLAVELIPDAYPDVREKLQLPEEKPEAIYLKRLFKLNGKPIAIGKSWLPSYLLPGFRERGMVNNSLTQTLKANYGLVPEMINDYIEVVRCTASEAKLLSSTADTPLLVVKGISLLKSGTPIEYAATSWLGDCVRFNINLKFSELG